MFPETLLKGIAWSVTDTTFESVQGFVAAVSEYQTAIELDPDWKSDAVSVEASKLTIVTEGYDENEEEVDISFEVQADGSAFTNGELLFRIHNAFAEKMQSGFEFGDHCFFEGLSLEDAADGRYACYLGS